MDADSDSCGRAPLLFGVVHLELPARDGLKECLVDTSRTTIRVQSERAVLAAVRLPGAAYDQADPFGELAALAEQAGAMVVGTIDQQRERPQAGTYMGKGKVEQLRDLCEQLDASLVIFDHELSPAQLGNIEKVVGRKIVDRSELILDIFAARATSHEAKLQVELAQLEYTYPRLRAMWSHLERIAGGAPVGIGTRGPGEQQLEIDRRLVRAKLRNLRRELAEIQTRKGREVRNRNRDHTTVGLVGYTNAGKSTLFNTLTAGGAYADDRLFATLISRTRQWDLGAGLSVMLSDTVGFVRDLPHNLIASFKATLEEATHADLLLIVLDVSDPAADLHYATVERTLNELFEEVAKAEGSSWEPPRRVVLLNKADLLKDNHELLVWRQRLDHSIAISSLPGEDGLPMIGAAELIKEVQMAAQGGVEELFITVMLCDSKTINTIENRGEVLDRSYEGDRVTLKINGVPVTRGTITVPFSGSSAGDISTLSNFVALNAKHTFAAEDAIEIETNGASTGTVGVVVTLGLEPT
ncbi:MAG: GTPase HflX [Planctomycetes bacterium]|nr:GTPase HflX [Planctomycetota bacterium]